MSDIKISQLPRTSTISPGDLLVVVSNPNTSPVTQSLSACKALPVVGGSGTGSAVSNNLLSNRANTASGDYSVAIGGINNVVSSCYASTIGGVGLSAGGSYTGVFAGTCNKISPTAAYSVIAGGTSNFDLSQGGNVILGGSGNCHINSSINSTIIGSNNISNSQISFVGGGTNIIGAGTGSGSYSQFIGGGSFNCIGTNSTYAGIIAGSGNTIINGCNTLIGGGLCNTASSNYSFIAGGQKNHSKGYNNTFILGSSLSATQADTTYVNNIIASGVTALTATLNTAPLTIVTAAKGSVFESLQNTFAGVSASSDISIYNDTANYLDMGIASSLYNGNLFGPKFNVVGAGDSYLYTTANDLVIGTSSPSISSDIIFFTGGTLSGTSVNSGNERLRITNTNGTYAGNVGVNTATPNQQLTVSGSISSTAMVYASTFSVGLTATGAVGGSNFGKFPIYSSTGVLLGYVPIYQS
jgi:hypothetical protein